MKKTLIALGLLVMATSLANAATVTIGVDGVAAPASIGIGESAVVDLSGFVASSTSEGVVGYLIVQGPGTISGGTVLQGDGSITAFDPTEEVWANFLASKGYTGVQQNLLLIDMLDMSDPLTDLNGKIVDSITFQGTGEGVATLTYFDPDSSTVYATQTITQVVPEPMTVTLLGLGGLFLRRRK
jgi:hypothetical protein